MNHCLGRFAVASALPRVFVHLSLLGLVMLASSVARADGAALSKGDRIVFLGDSITEAGAGEGGYVTLVKQTITQKLPDLGIEVIGAGISGNRVPDLEKRLERDVLSKKPTIVVIYIGINDVWHSQQGRGTPKDEFEAGLKRIIEQIEKVGARVLLCTPSVIGEKTDGDNKLDAMLDEYCEISRAVAKETGSQRVDLRAAFMSHLGGSNAQQADSGVLTSDGVHLNAAGNQFVADQMLEALGVIESPRRLRHMVLFKFKEGVTAEEIREVVEAFGALPSKIDTIVDFEQGTDVSVENLADGFTHGFLVTFRDAAGRDVYLPHAAHKEFVDLVRPKVEKVLVFDYWTGR